MIFVTLDMASATLECRRRFKNVPQRFGTGLTVRGEVVKRGDELVTLVCQTVRLLTLGGGLGVHVLPALALVSVQDLNEGGGGVNAGGPYKQIRSRKKWRVGSDLEYSWDLVGLGTVNVTLGYRTHVKQFTVEDSTSRSTTIHTGIKTIFLFHQILMLISEIKSTNKYE